MDHTRAIRGARVGVIVAALAAPLAAAPASLAAPAAAAAPARAMAPRHPATGYRTWLAAQRAAGFKLLKPTRFYGLHKNGRIQVTRCAVAHHPRAKLVGAFYINRRSLLAIEQNNAGVPCSKLGVAKKLRTYRVDGVTATLYGFCGIQQLPPCGRRSNALVLIWRKKGLYYQAFSLNEWRAALVGFARSLRRV